MEQLSVTTLCCKPEFDDDKILENRQPFTALFLFGHLEDEIEYYRSDTEAWHALEEGFEFKRFNYSVCKAYDRIFVLGGEGYAYAEKQELMRMDKKSRI